MKRCITLVLIPKNWKEKYKKKTKKKVKKNKKIRMTKNMTMASMMTMTNLRRRVMRMIELCGC